ncbi:MAG: N-acetylmuramoyl-L-alanine amidase [Nanoarchaeota archaeon]|nr:N-acetylmuramoyl-L-alanine amidase [Nanoarchaeota archaeon]
MPGLIINKRAFQLAWPVRLGSKHPSGRMPMPQIVNYYDLRGLKLRAPEDMRARRGRHVQSIGLHNTKAIETHVLPGRGPDTRLEHRITQWWSMDKVHAGAHLCVDHDLTVGCLADLLLDAAYHASSMNELSIGIEIYEDTTGRVYQEQLEVVIVLVEWLCAFFGIQRQMPSADDDGVVERIRKGGSTFHGVYGHCHQYSGKQKDPGRDIFKALRAAGFQEFDFNKSEDLGFWAPIQRKLGVEADGIPGPITTDALRDAGYKDGLWRPAENSGA